MKIDGKSTEKISLTDAVKKLRGEPGTECSLIRPAPQQRRRLLTFKLTRSQIKIETVRDIDGKKEFPLE